jgi:hypothetical protein
VAVQAVETAARAQACARTREEGQSGQAGGRQARVAELEGKLVDVDARLAEPKTYADADLTARLGREREDLQQLAKAEEAWSALYDEA